MPNCRRDSLIGALILLAAPCAYAHPLTAHSAAWQAFVHPFTGIDHVLAMLVIGSWSALRGARCGALPPLAFIAGLVAGAVLGTLGMNLPRVDFAIALSVAALGPLAARRVQLSQLACFALCSSAGLLHGYAHGLELGDHGLASACFVLGSIALHGIGYGVARGALARGQRRLLQESLRVSGVVGLGLLWMA